MKIEDIESLKELIELALNLNSKANQKADTKNLITELRRFTGSPNALNKSKIYSYKKNKKLPDSLMETAALTYLILKNNPEAISSDYELRSNELDFSFKCIGFKFDQIDYTCELIRSDNFPQSLDAKITTIHQGITLHSGYDSVNYCVESLADTDDESMIHVEILLKGPGLTKQPTITTNKQILINSDGKKSIKIKSIYKIEINKDANHESSIIFKRLIKKSFSLAPGLDSQTTERSGFIIRAPTKKLKMRMVFPANIFKAGSSPVVNIANWWGYTPDMESIDYNKFSIASLGSTSCLPYGRNGWEWKSLAPPLTGMIYALVYNPSQVYKSLKAQNDEN